MKILQEWMRLLKKKRLKGGGVKLVIDWIWLCHMAFKCAIGPEYWRSAVIVPLYKGKGEKNDNR